MSDEVEQLVGRLVVGRKRDMRKVFDEGAKAEPVALCHSTQSPDPRAWAGTPARSLCKAGGTARGVRRVAGRGGGHER